MLQQGAEYKFSISADKGTQGENRFELTSVTPAMAHTEKDGLQVNMVPNPATDVVTINYTNTQKESLSVRILDLAGVCIYNNNTGTVESGSIAVPLSKYAAGIYMVEIVSGSQKIVQKLVKE